MSLPRTFILLTLILIIFLILLFTILLKDNPENLACLNCNLLLISIDTLRADHIGLINSDKTSTPFIDSFFEKKSIFEKAITPAPCTTPAVNQMLTSRYRNHKSFPTIAEILKTEGYSTLAVVSQHRFGWKEKPKQIYSRGFDLFDIQPLAQKDRHRMSSRTANQVTDQAINIINKQKNNKFFLWLHYFDPHDPYFPNEGNINPKELLPEGDVRQKYKDYYEKIGKKRWTQQGDIFTKQEKSFYQNQYADEVTFTDKELGRLFEYLELNDLLDNTIIVLTSDHGEWLGEEDKWNHCKGLEQREIHVPLLMRMKTNVFSEHTLQNPVSTLDILPTILQLIGLNHTHEFDGRDLAQDKKDNCVLAYWGKEKAVYIENLKLKIKKNQKTYYEINGTNYVETTQNNIDSKKIQFMNNCFDIHLSKKMKEETLDVEQNLRKIGYLS